MNIKVKKRNLSGALYAALLIGLLSLTPSEGSAEEVVDRVVARVNDEVILLSEFNQRAAPVLGEFEQMFEGPDKEERSIELQMEMLDQMIDERLLLQKAREKDISVSSSEIDQGVDEIRNRFSSEMEFQNEITRQGFTEQEFRENIRDQMMVIKLINQEVRDKIPPPTEEEAREYYEANREDMVTPERVGARHILIRITDDRPQEEAQEKAREVYEKVAEDPSMFSDYAEEYSEGPSAQAGGDLGYFARGEMVSEFEDVAFGLDVGDISEPFMTRFGYHIVRVTGREGSERRTYSEVRDRLKNMLYQMRMEEEYEKFLRDLRDEARITRSLF